MVERNEPSWAQIVMARVAAGDAAALGEVYDELGGRVYSLARRITRDTTLAEEVTQEVFCQLWTKPSAYDPHRGSLRTFLATMAHRRAVDCIRRTDAARRRDLTYYRETSSPSEADVAEAVDANLVAEDVRAAIDDLPEDQRRSILLVYFEGFTFRQLAEHLAIPEGTAKTRVRLGLAKLGTALGSRGLMT